MSLILSLRRYYPASSEFSKPCSKEKFESIVGRFSDGSINSAWKLSWTMDELGQNMLALQDKGLVFRVWDDLKGKWYKYYGSVILGTKTSHVVIHQEITLRLPLSESKPPLRLWVIATDLREIYPDLQDRHWGSIASMPSRSISGPE